MIISASYKTDIPTFYGEWFRNRLRAGYCKMANPFNRNQRHTISLRRENVDGFVFWTKNITPFLGVLDEVRERGYPFIVQYTLNGYPKALESRVVDASCSINSFRSLAERFGNRVAIWRYDTIIHTSLTNQEFHLRNFEEIARELSGATDEVVVSFMQLFKKTHRNMDDAARRCGFNWQDPHAETKRELLRKLAATAASYKMRLSICTQPELLVEGVSEARCVDAQRLMDVGGRHFQANLKGMRMGCGCFKSTDIGDYDTCPHGCVYCYAVQSRDLALKRYEEHDPNGEYLFPQGPEMVKPAAQDQLTLFRDDNE